MKILQFQHGDIVLCIPKTGRCHTKSCEQNMSENGMLMLQPFLSPLFFPWMASLPRNNGPSRLDGKWMFWSLQPFILFGSVKRVQTMYNPNPFPSIAKNCTSNFHLRGGTHRTASQQPPSNPLPNPFVPSGCVETRN